MAHTARDVARHVVRRVLSERGYASLVLSAQLDRAGLDRRERALATQLVYGTLRHLSRLDRALAAMTRRGLKTSPAMWAALRVAAYQIMFLDRVPDHAAVSDAVTAARKLGGARMAGFANGVLRRLAREGEPALPPPRPIADHIAAKHSLPMWLAQRVARAFDGDPDQLERAADGLNGPARLAVRVNRPRIATDALIDRLRANHPDGLHIDRSPHCPDALLLTGLGDPERSPAFRDGLFAVQDLGAQLVAHLAAATDATARDDGERVRVLDACAGAGGKTVQLAALLGERAVIDAADRSQTKLDLLDQTAKRMGATGIFGHCIDLTRPPDAWSRRYDIVVLDAPCSGLGVIRRHPEAKWRIGEDDIARLARVQASLLDAVAGCVRPGGVLVYSVCTFTDEEGARQVSRFVEKYSAFAVTPPASAPPDWRALGPAPGMLATWPHRHDADAFFAARLRRK